MLVFSPVIYNHGIPSGFSASILAIGRNPYKISSQRGDFPFAQPDGKQNGSPLPTGRQKREFLGEYVRLARVGPTRADFERKSGLSQV
jgi:hypothetical protein